MQKGLRQWEDTLATGNEPSGTGGAYPSRSLGSRAVSNHNGTSDHPIQVRMMPFVLCASYPYAPGKVGFTSCFEIGYAISLDCMQKRQPRLLRSDAPSADSFFQSLPVKPPLAPLRLV
jgi:hypothetical protein